MSISNLAANLGSYREKAKLSSLLSTQQLTFEKALQSNNYLVQEEEEANQEEEKRMQVQKKKIQSYVKNRDTLYIEPPERVKKPIDISKNLIEPKIQKNVIDLGIQSDEINYVDKTKPFLQQKIGRDASTQIEDGDLFVFDRDVEPIITVVMGKLLEQVNLELNEEDEIKRIREAKTNFTKRLVDEKQRVLKVEDEEIKKKRDNDNIKKLKKAEKANKANAQRKIMARIFSKNYLKNIKVNTLSFLEERGLFNPYLVESTKDKIRAEIYSEAEKFEVEDSELDKLLDDVDDNLLKTELISHKDKLSKRNKELEEERLRQEQQKRLEEEEAKKKWEGKLERARQRKIQRLKEEIQKAVFEAGVQKNEVYNEDISEIDNYMQEGAYIGIYGGTIAAFMLSIINLKANFFKQDNFYILDSVMEMLSGYLSSSGKIYIPVLASVEEELKKIVPDIELKTLNTNTNLEAKDWKEISNVISAFNYCADPFLKQLIIENNLDIATYSLIIKAVVMLLEKGKENEKIVFIANNEATVEERLAAYRAYCILKIDSNPTSAEILNSADWNKDRKRKNVKVPDFNNLNKVCKYYTITPDYRVLINDKTAEFLIRNKVLESCTKAIVMRFDISDMDATPMFVKFNEFYDSVMTKIDFSEKIQVLEYLNDPQAVSA